MTAANTSKAINKYCPRSGKPVSENALTEYRGLTVGFCNPGCRDDFARELSASLKQRASLEEHASLKERASPKDCAYFDVLIKELELALE